MKRAPSGKPDRRSGLWFWIILTLACALGAATWFLLSRALPRRVPDDFPQPPDSIVQNPALRNLILAADAEARQHPAWAQATGKLAMTYHANQLYPQAASAYGIAARLVPRDYRWRYCQALVQEETGQQRNLAPLLKETLVLRPGYTPAGVKLADLYFKQDDLAAAARHYGQAIDAAGRSAAPQAVFGMGRVAARQGDWRKVVEYLAPLAREYPRLRPAHQLLAQAYEALGNNSHAAEERRTLLRSDLQMLLAMRDPLADELAGLCRSSTHLLKLAGFAERVGDSDQALRLARQAVEVEPEDADARHFLARALVKYRGGDPAAVKEALGHVSEGLRLRPENLRPLLLIADVFFRQGRAEEAVEQLRVLLATNAGSAEAHYYLGVATEQQGKIDEAIGRYREALRLDPEYPEAHNRLGHALAQKGKLAEAIEQFRTAVRLKPTFALAHYNLGLALERRGNTSEAITHYSEVIRLEPDDAAAHLNLGLVLAQHGRFGEAAGHFREVVRIMPAGAEGHYDLGSALARLGKVDEAVEQLREALRLQPDYEDARNELRQLEQRKR